MGRDFEEEKHPRAPNGKFTGDGGDLQSWARVGSKKGLESRTDLKQEGWGGGKGKEGSVKNAANGKKLWMLQQPKNLKEQTWMGNYNADPEKGGKVSEERRKNVQEPIISKTVDSVEAPGKGEPKMAIFTMGGPGSGKSSMTSDVDPKKFVHVDPDEVRAQLPEYKQTTRGDVVFRYAASMSHPEASDIAKQITKRAIDQGKHLLIDGTGVNAKSIISKMEQLRKAGYHIHLAYAHLAAEEGVKRVGDRAEKTGRYVPESFVRDAYDKIPKNFQDVAKHSDSFAVHDTAQKGAPIMWRRGADGKEMGDEKFMKDFKSRFPAQEQEKK